MNYKNVTVWHKTNQEYKRILFERAVVTESCGISGAAAGEVEENSVLIRAYTLYECGIKPGDRLCVGYDEALRPPKEAYVISEVTGFFNVGAGLRHYRFKCR